MSRILVVEDDEVLRNELIELLRNEGYAAEYISTFSDTAGQIIKSKPDLVLLDINIPELNGELVLRKLRKETDIPVIMVTSRTSESDEVLSMSYGADDYITKPYNPTILMLRISAVIKRTRKQDSSEADTGEKGIYQYRQAAVNTAKGTLSRGENACRIIHHPEGIHRSPEAVLHKPPTRLSAKQLPTKSIRSAAPISKSAFGISISVLNRIIRICNQSISLRGFAIPAIPSCAFSPQPLHLL